MNRDEVKHLATLARLKLSDNELDTYAKELGDILGYIEKIKEVSGADDSSRVESASVRNVLREDADPVPADTFKEDLLACAPETRDGYIKVKKIL